MSDMAEQASHGATETPVTQEDRALFQRWCDEADESLQAELARLAEDGEALHDAFYRTLVFGTGGLRGIIGAGPNRMNIHTVAQATQGLANYLNENFTGPSVAIARDSRLMGEEFCKVAACVLAANGVHAMLYPRIEPTPALSFAVRDLRCSAGINVTASHNPAEYNGYKAYGPDGCQITSKAAAAIQKAIDGVDVFADVRRIGFEEGIEKGLISYIGEGTLDRFIDAVAAASMQTSDEESLPLKLAYTPLHGTGLECVGRILERIGVTDVSVEPSQAVADGHFPTCPYPNPEERKALERGLRLAESTGADLLVATDPDADRVGIAVVKDGVPVLLSGNEIGELLADFVCRKRLERGDDLRDAVVITTVVSSLMMDALSDKYGFELRRTLTGFKYIGEQIGMLESAGEVERFIFGFEESYGYLSSPHVRDKDAVNASMLLCEAARYYRARGMDLVDAMAALYDELGYFANKTLSFAYPGSSGAQRMDALMAGLREEPPREISGMGVLGFVDYLPGVPMSVRGGRRDAPHQILPASNVLAFALDGGAKVIVRPSGTEPKIKAYLFAQAESPEAADARIARLEEAVSALLA